MKLFLIDGHALVFKMYYAFLGRPMVNSKGVDTSILFGFTKYLLELIERERPTHIAVSFDPPGGTFRNELYPDYKANRAETPQLVIDALEPLTRIVRALDIPVLMIPGFEADDVIGSMAKRSAREGLDVYMVTPDKDYGQLVEPHILQYRPGKSGSDNEILGEAQICEKWGISSTAQVIDILALCGASADTVPGVAGIGPVSASKLLARYGTLEGIYEHIGELTASQQAKFEAARGHIGLSKTLVTIKTDIPLDVTAADMVFDTRVTPEVRAIFDEFEFPSLKRKLEAVAVAAVEDAPDLFSAAAEPSEPAFKAEYNTVEAPEICRLAASEGVLAVNFTDTSKVSAATLHAVCTAPAAQLRTVLEDPSVAKAGSDLKRAMNLLRDDGIELRGRMLDIELMHYLLNPERSHKTDVLARAYLGLDIESAAEAPAELSLFDDASEGQESDRSLETFAIRHLTDALLAEMDSTDNIRKLYDEIEEPLVGVLARMEQTGVRVDPGSLREFAESLRKRMIERETQVREIAGNPSLNVSSPKQVGELIFERLRLDPKAKKPKSGSWPTDEQTLQELSDRSPVIEAILDYRGTRKLLSTYIEPLPGYIRSDGRVHTTFNQALTSTGRLSSSNPNLQNIPIRTDEGREIRKAFVPGTPGWVMMSADYSQIELRLMAHLCGDAHMVEAFRAGQDVHSSMAAKIFHKPLSEVTAADRRVAKTANFGIMYGISSFGLSQRLGCSRGEAKQIIDDYFASFPSIREFIDGTLEAARRDGYVSTLFGRRRYVPDVGSHNGNVRAVAERNAINAPIQGTAADIIKIAMAGVDRALREGGFKARMVLQIHDELVLEVPRDEIGAVREILVREMEGVVRLSVPLTVECNYGDTWLEAH